MAAEIRSSKSKLETETKIELLDKLEGHQDIVIGAFVFDKEDGILTIGDDKTVRIWVKRETGIYWPTACQFMPSCATCFRFHERSRRLFIGLDNGLILDISINEDFNYLTKDKSYISHYGKVNDLYYSFSSNLILTVGKDKFLKWYSSESGTKLGWYLGKYPFTAIQLDEQTNFAFIGNTVGEILIIKIVKKNFFFKNKLKAHSKAIRCLNWDIKKKILFSVSNDQVVICWDIGGKQGTAFELQGHSNKISSVCFAPEVGLLFSGGEDQMIIAWDMNIDRIETPIWKESNNCQKCNRPFFWNIKSMLDKKQIGLRQHHCRKCGNAVCNLCSSNKSYLPKLGYEFKVRLCDSCFYNLTYEDQISLARFYDSKHVILSLDLNVKKKILVTCGSDRTAKVWDISKLLLFTQENKGLVLY